MLEKPEQSATDRYYPGIEVSKSDATDVLAGNSVHDWRNECRAW